MTTTTCTANLLDTHNHNINEIARRIERDDIEILRATYREARDIAVSHGEAASDFDAHNTADAGRDLYKLSVARPVYMAALAIMTAYGWLLEDSAGYTRANLWIETLIGLDPATSRAWRRERVESNMWSV